MTASMTTTSTTATDAAPPRRGYGALWAKVPREFGFLILTMPIAIIGLVVLSTVFFTGLGLVTIFVGIFLDGRRVLHRPRIRHARAHPPAVGRAPRDPPTRVGHATAASRASGDRRSRRSSTATTGCTCCTRS